MVSHPVLGYSGAISATKNMRPLLALSFRQAIHFRFSTTKSARGAAVKKNVSERIAKEPQA
jgi:hypothetical protein